MNNLANMTNAANQFRVLEDIGNETTKSIIHAGHFIAELFNVKRIFVELPIFNVDICPQTDDIVLAFESKERLIFRFKHRAASSRDNYNFKFIHLFLLYKM